MRECLKLATASIQYDRGGVARRMFVALLLIAGLAGCGTEQQEAAPTVAAKITAADVGGTDVPPTMAPLPPTPDQRNQPQVNIEAPAPGTTQPVYGMTNLQPDGNRTVAGMGQLPEAPFVDVPLSERPMWVVGADDGQGVVWVVTLANGQNQAFRIVAGQPVTVSITPETLRPGTAPALEVQGGRYRLLASPTGAPGLNHPVVIDGITGRWAFTHLDGRLTVAAPGDPQGDLTLDVQALPDARLLQDGLGQMLLLSQPTERYSHGVLGDGVEAAGVTLVSLGDAPQVLRTFGVPETDVIEGIAPIWTDLNGDGRREILLTLSNADEGARIAVYDEQGTLLASGPAIGTGFRWRHALAVAPFGPGGELELAVVRTPHLGGIVEFYRWQGDELAIVAQISGYTSHMIGTRNLDMGAAADFDGDGRLELLLPSQDRSRLGAIRHGAEGVVEVWSLPAGGHVVTNVAAVSNGGDVHVAAGVEEGVLRIWGD